jgi:hypothetical protein
MTNQEVFTIGQLLGLISGTADNYTVDTGWFADPVTNIAGIGDRLATLVQLLADVFPALSNPPVYPPHGTWFPMEVNGTTLLPVDSAGQNLYLVAVAANGDAKAEVGIGLSLPFGGANVSVSGYAYLPVFASDTSGAYLFPGPQETGSGPVITAGLTFTGKQPFSSNGATFTAVNFQAQLFLNATEPNIQVTFEGLKGTALPATYNTLTGLLGTDVTQWLATIVLQAGDWLNLKPPGLTSITYGNLLVNAKFMQQTSPTGPYSLALDALQPLTALEIAQNALFGILDPLAGSTPLVKLPPNNTGGIYLTKDTAANTSTYGLRLVTQTTLSGGSGGDDKSLQQAPSGAPPQPKTQIDLCIGQMLTGETDKSNWLTNAGYTGPVQPGITLLLFSRDSTDNTYAWVPQLQLSSVGLNIQGGGDAALLDKNGYTLKGVDLRGFLVPPSGTSTSYQYGFAIRLDDVGFPVAGELSSASGSANPVASTLVASGNSGDSGDSDAKQTVNPTFSAKSGYLKGGSAFFQAIDATGANTDVIWYPVQRRFGPVDCTKVGVEVNLDSGDWKLGLLLDGSVKLGGLEIDVDELGVTVDLSTAGDLTSYEIDLQGLAITFNSDSVEISGGLKRSVVNGAPEYDGEALIKFQDLTIAALGSFASLPHNGGTSLFIFAVLDKALGGPACFYVTGLAAGFGYNRALKIPALSDVQDFPLLAGLTDSSAMGGSNPDPGTVLAKMAAWVPPQLGEYWLAAGVQFTTFDIIETNALLLVEFGKDTEIAVLGISVVQQPAEGDTYVYAQIDLDILILPELGEIQASAVLADSSYVLTKDAHLTGGFAFYAWFGDNAHAGDFVFTIGGYHPAFLPPDYYPAVPRLGINWPVDDNLSIVGTAYFALTPAAMMAGGALQATFQDGGLKAWLAVQIDILLYWSPFYLLADGSISVGVSYTFSLAFCHVTLSAEIGASFQLWGPPVGGTVSVEWYIISFTIGFGADQTSNNSLSWEQFKGMLPSKSASSSASLHLPGHLDRSFEQLETAAESPETLEDAPVPAYLNIIANEGLKSEQTATVSNGSTIKIWIVRAGTFQFTMGSAVPASVLTSANPAPAMPVIEKTVGMRKVNSGISADDYQSTQSFAVVEFKAASAQDFASNFATLSGTVSNLKPVASSTLPDISAWSMSPLTKGMPQAMWGDTPSGAPSADPSKQTVPGTLGLVVTVPDFVLNNASPVMAIDTVFADDSVAQGTLPLSPAAPPIDPGPPAANSFADIAQIMSAPVVATRAAVCQALLDFGISGWSNGDLPLMAANPGRDFADEPMEV